MNCTEDKREKLLSFAKKLSRGHLNAFRERMSKRLSWNIHKCINTHNFSFSLSRLSTSLLASSLSQRNPAGRRRRGICLPTAWQDRWPRCHIFSKAYTSNSNQHFKPAPVSSSSISIHPLAEVEREARNGQREERRLTSTKNLFKLNVAIRNPKHRVIPPPNTRSCTLHMFARRLWSPSNHLSGRNTSASSPNTLLFLNNPFVFSPILTPPGTDSPHMVSPSAGTRRSRRAVTGGKIRSPSLMQACR